MTPFDHTCALSELAISQGDDVLIVALVHVDPGREEPDKGAFSLFEIALPPIRASYDGHGFADGAHCTPFHEAFARAMGQDSARSLLDAIKRGAATLYSSHSPSPRPVRFCMARSDAWAAMLGMPSVEPRRGGGLDANALLAPAAREGALVFARAPELLAKLDLDALRARIEMGSYDHDRLALMLMNTYLMEGVDDKGPFATMFGHRLASSHSGADLFAGASTLSMLAIDMPEAGADRQSLENALLLYGETMLVSQAMGNVRKLWLPRGNGGPGLSEDAMHWLWARKLGELASGRIPWDEGADGPAGRLAGFEEARALRERDGLGAASAPRLSSTPKAPRSSL